MTLYMALFIVLLELMLPTFADARFVFGLYLHVEICEVLAVLGNASILDVFLRNWQDIILVQPHLEQHSLHVEPFLATSVVHVRIEKTCW